jgi:asparagine synthase (glutamine-hydrolysing)
MCGIFGISGIQVSKSHFSEMLSVQSHRGPDFSGVYMAEDHMLALGHNRLRILDLTDNGNQPFISNDGRYVIIFNGEVYNYLEIRETLKSEVKFRTNTDTEVVLYSFIKYGKSCMDMFVGMFAFVIFDRLENECFAARDRFGVKPFYYNSNGSTLVFASEIK